MVQKLTADARNADRIVRERVAARTRFAQQSGAYGGFERGVDIVDAGGALDNGARE